MSNSYNPHVPNEYLLGSQEEYDALRAAFDKDTKGSHGFVLKYKDGEILLYADHSGTPSELPKRFLELFGKQIENNLIPYVEYGYAIYSDKMRAGEFGGGYYRINTKGEIIEPQLTWPEE